MSSVLALRELLEQRFPGAQPVAPGGSARPAGTGFRRLDMLLPEGGLPRGRLTHWQVGGGATALLRGACAAAVERGERAGWIDGARVASGAFWREGPLLFRPEDRTATLECAEELLRSGGFGVVVVALGGVARPQPQMRAVGSGRGLAASGEDAELVRLSRVAREGGAALVVLGPRSPVAALRVRSTIEAGGWRWRLDPFGEPAEVAAVRVRVEATTAGWSGATELELPVAQPEQRLALEPTLPDRRGAKRSSGRRRGSRVNGGRGRWA